MSIYLLGIRNEEQLAHDPLRGNIYENMVDGERLKQIANEGKTPELYFFRTAKGFEIDLLEKGDDAPCLCRFYLSSKICIDTMD